MTGYRPNSAPLSSTAGSDDAIDRKRRGSAESGTTLAVRPGGGTTRATRRGVVITADRRLVASHVAALERVVGCLAVVSPESGLFECTMRDPADIVVVAVSAIDAELREILLNIRFAGSSWRHAGVVVLAPVDAARSPRGADERGANAVLPLDADPAQLLAWERLLARVAPRVHVRVPVVIESSDAALARRAMCQTENLSVSGMLVRSGTPVRPDSRIRFDFRLPDVAWKITGEGTVVRPSEVPRDPVEGLAIRFIHLNHSCRGLVESFVTSAAGREGARLWR